MIADVLYTFVTTLLKLLALLTPPLAVSAFSSATRGKSAAETKRMAHKSAMTILGLGLVLYFFGEEIFFIFGFTLDAFRIGCGVLLFVTAVGVINSPAGVIFTMREDEDITLVPLTVPIIMGPATIGTIMVWGSTHKPWSARLAEAAAIVVAAFIMWLTMRMSHRIEKALGPSWMAFAGKMMGLVLAALAAQIFFEGLQGYLLPK